MTLVKHLLSDCVAGPTPNLGPCLATFSASYKTVPFGLPLLLFSCEFQSSVCFSIDSSSFPRVLPIYRHFLILICNKLYMVNGKNNFAPLMETWERLVMIPHIVTTGQLHTSAVVLLM
jgi:hypothetical protein